ncbi:complement C1q-like protein 2 [Sardina pilchardus]|uniref:complement C1q-like protein 2 n=1 Tax=Sardina pilchardus TaxID=27697 RepID=UPI002E13909A
MVVELRVLLTVTQNDLQKVDAENDDLLTEMIVLKTRLSASETEVEDLKMVTAAEMTTVKTRLSTSETELTAVKTRLAATETDVVNLEKEITDQPKVAFSARLGISGYINAGNTELNLVFTKIITNVGQAYSSTTGFFTAPVRGVYYFRFTVADMVSSRYMYIKMFKNSEQIMYIHEYGAHEQWTYLSSGATLQLEVGDVVNMRLPAGNRLSDNAGNHNIFSGFLLFPL